MRLKISVVKLIHFVLLMNDLIAATSTKALEEPPDTASTADGGSRITVYWTITILHELSLCILHYCP
jgi:hypothetical protein